METTRFILIFSLALIGMMLWQAWEQDYGLAPEAKAPVDRQRETTVAKPAADIPSLSSTELDVGEPVSNPQKKAAEKARPIVVETDVFKIEIDLQGAGIEKAELRQYPLDPEKPEEAFVLMDRSAGLFYITQGGLLSTRPAPNHEQMFVADQYSYVLVPGQDVLRVPLRWESADGVKVTKTFEFARGQYLVNISYKIENNSGEEWRGRAYQQIKRNDPGRAGRMLIYTYTGAVISSPENRYEKIDFDDMREQRLQQEISNGWAAMIQHYFVTALVPVDKTLPYQYYTMSLPENRFAIGAIGPATAVAASASGLIKEQIYLGPKTHKRLIKVTEGLELTVDFGILWFIAKPLFQVLDWFHDMVGNWGWAIILVTLLLKLIFYPLSAAGYRSMANMRRVQPRIMSIRERYKNDKAHLNQAMMQIYKEEKINPLGGCFPILVQIPVFISLYWVLLESVELRQAGFIFWWQDLSSPDPYFVLPIIMGATMLIQQKLNPAPMDPIQEGLVLYWVANNILSIAQQWRITRVIERTGQLQQKK